MLDVAGTTLADDERELLMHPGVGGVILFSRNYESVEQVCELTAVIHALREPRLLVAVDQEGGRVQRLRGAFTRLPAMARFGELYDSDPARALGLARESGWIMASELRSVGIDFSFAPVLDLRYSDHDAIGERALHHDPQSVAELARAIMQGAREAAMPVVGKHFPGHGTAKADSHLTLPVDPRPFESVAAHDLLAFERMIHYGLPAIMTAHVLFPAVDDRAATFSRFWLTDILRVRLGFSGPIFSDDIVMAGAAVAGSPADRFALARRAGCDMVLVCNDHAAVRGILDAGCALPDAVVSSRLARMHGRRGMALSVLERDPRYRSVRTALGRLD